MWELLWNTPRIGGSQTPNYRKTFYTKYVCLFSLTSSIMVSKASDSSALVASLATMFLSLKQYSLSCKMQTTTVSTALWIPGLTGESHMWADWLSLNWVHFVDAPCDLGCRSFCVRPRSCATLESTSLERHRTFLEVKTTVVKLIIQFQC